MVRPCKFVTQLIAHTLKLISNRNTSDTYLTSTQSVDAIPTGLTLYVNITYTIVPLTQ